MWKAAEEYESIKRRVTGSGHRPNTSIGTTGTSFVFKGFKIYILHLLMCSAA